jgi:hypothetical protein
MVYCTKCGSENEDDALNCKSCGEPLREEIIPRRYRRRRRDDDLCFGSGEGSWIGIFIGLMIILAGVSELFQGTFWWASWDRLWPIPVIVFGLLIVYNAYSKR